MPLNGSNAGKTTVLENLNHHTKPILLTVTELHLVARSRKFYSLAKQIGASWFYLKSSEVNSTDQRKRVHSVIMCWTNSFSWRHFGIFACIPSQSQRSYNAWRKQDSVSHRKRRAEVMRCPQWDSLHLFRRGSHVCVCTCTFAPPKWIEQDHVTALRC